MNAGAAGSGVESRWVIQRRYHLSEHYHLS